MSYRKDGQIFWTKHKLTLRAGELVLADGRYLVRARCANQISFAPQEPVDPIPSDAEHTSMFRSYHSAGLHSLARCEFTAASSRAVCATRHSYCQSLHARGRYADAAYDSGMQRLQ